MLGFELMSEMDLEQVWVSRQLYLHFSFLADKELLPSENMQLGALLMST